MILFSPASAVMILHREVALTEEMVFKTDMRTRALNSKNVKAARPLGLLVKVNASYAPEALEHVGDVD